MHLDGKRILVTGGTGSLGNALVRRLLSGEMGVPEKVTIFSRDEAKQHMMRLEYLERTAATDDVIYKHSKDILRFQIGDIRDYAAVSTAVRNQDIIFHAAALKQVPTCEYFPFEAVQTNVIGAQNVARAVIEHGPDTETVIGISTDKACKPVNVMGITKALQERILIQANMAPVETRFMCVRYGNVIASRGSVVPLFVDQIRQGGPVTITMREMTRFLLSLDQAVDTVLAALQHGARGDTFIPRAEAARVVDIVTALANGAKVPVTFTGIRPGEKVHEIMVSEEERYRTTASNGYYVIRPVLPELRPEPTEPTALEAEYSSEEVTLDVPGLQKLLSDYIANPALVGAH